MMIVRLSGHPLVRDSLSELYAQNNKLLLREAPNYDVVCTFKDAYLSSVWLTRTHARNHKEKQKKRKNEKGEKRNEQRYVSGLTRRIFGVEQCSMGSALRDYPMHCEGGMLLQ